MGQHVLEHPITFWHFLFTGSDRIRTNGLLNVINSDISTFTFYGTKTSFWDTFLKHFLRDTGLNNDNESMTPLKMSKYS